MILAGYPIHVVFHDRVGLSRKKQVARSHSIRQPAHGYLRRCGVTIVRVVLGMRQRFHDYAMMTTNSQSDIERVQACTR